MALAALLGDACSSRPAIFTLCAVSPAAAKEGSNPPEAPPRLCGFDSQGLLQQLEDFHR
jgi:hypothetical protein